MHDDVIKWKHFPRYWPFVRGIHRSPVNSPHKGQWRGALMFSLMCVRMNGSVNNREAGDLRRYHAHYDVTVMVRRVSGGYPIFASALWSVTLQEINQSYQSNNSSHYKAIIQTLLHNTDCLLLSFLFHGDECVVFHSLYSHSKPLVTLTEFCMVLQSVCCIQLVRTTQQQ